MAQNMRYKISFKTVHIQTYKYYKTQNYFHTHENDFTLNPNYF